MLHQSCCFTGHRSLSPDCRERLRRTLLGLLPGLIGQDGIRQFYCGGARGFDTLCAECVLQLKPLYPAIALHLLLPCPDSVRGWSAEERGRFRRVLEQADDVQYISDHYYAGCMHLRNRALVDSAAVCVCYLQHSQGGTGYTVQYALQRGRRLVEVTPEGWRNTR